MLSSVEGSGNATMEGRVEEIATKEEDHVFKQKEVGYQFQI